MKDKALKLAAELDVASSEMEYNHVVDDWKLLSDSADMLRQQHDEIIGLKLEWQVWFDISERQKAEIDELRKYVGFKNSGYDIIQLPLQTKPLSDEELLNMWWDVEDDEALIKFARAIEERHGIK